MIGRKRQIVHSGQSFYIQKRRVLQLACSIAWLCGLATVPAHGSTYFPVSKVCAVGGEKFEFLALGSISTFGELPDGMPIGSGTFPVAQPQCPNNGLVMYRDFAPREVKALSAWVESAEYKALRSAHETPYYLAYRTARQLGDANAVWLLLSASWEAKNDETAGDKVNRYNEEFATIANAAPSDASTFESIALRARAANALRELARFAEAEALRASITIAADAGGTGQEAAANRSAWRDYLAQLAGPIARLDRTRAPIDMIGKDEAASRCIGKELAAKHDWPAPEPLTAFEQTFCTGREMVEIIADQRRSLLD